MLFVPLCAFNIHSPPCLCRKFSYKKKKKLRNFPLPLCLALVPLHPCCDHFFTLLYTTTRHLSRKFSEKNITYLPAYLLVPVHTYLSFVPLCLLHLCLVLLPVIHT
jgi:hypothetical protein